jgi:glycosyltransferase involved in cell wall biosynthesis
VIRLFESGVDLDVWTAGDRGSPGTGSNVNFVFSGRFVDWKGIEYLVDAFAKVVARAPHCRLHLIGGGELEGKIKVLIAHHKLNEVVSLYGWVSRPEAARIMRKADVFVMPSLRECGGTAILEALALGKPVVSTNWGGPADYVNSRCGILVDPTSKSDFVSSLEDAMLRLAASPELRHSLGEAGTQRVREDFLDWNSKSERVLSILMKVVSSKRSCA